MFGCTRALSKYSSESKSLPTPTHVNMYDVSNPDLLGREGMILVAMMSGGDYYPQGIPGCGTKIASAAAKGGFGKSLCLLEPSDEEGRQNWRESLMHELRTNESKFFQRKSPALALEMSKGDFPDMEILQYYKHPSVSQSLGDITEKITRKKDIHVQALREFTREKLGWDFRIGAIWFMRQLAPALLVQSMLNNESSYASLVECVSNRRLHWSADAAPELRVTYVPEKVVSILLEEEVEGPMQVSQAPQVDQASDDLGEDGLGSQSSLRKEYDVTKTESLWVLETVARKTIPRLVDEWEEAERVRVEARSKRTAAKSKPKPRAAKAVKDLSMPQGAIEDFIQYSKATATSVGASASGKLPDEDPVRKADDTVAMLSPKTRPKFHMLPSSPGSASSKETSPARPAKPPLNERSSGLPKIPRTPTKPTSRDTEKTLLPSSPPATLDRPLAAGEDQLPEAVMPGAALPKQVASSRKATPKASPRTAAAQANGSASKQRQSTLDAFTVKTNTTGHRTGSQASEQPRFINLESDDDDDDDDDLPSLPVLLSLESGPPKPPSKRHGSPKSRGRTPMGPTRRTSKKQCSLETSTASGQANARRHETTREGSPAKTKGRPPRRAQGKPPPGCEVVDLTGDD